MPRSISIHGELTSVWTRSDAELLKHLLTIYPRTTPRTIVDVCYGKGIFYKGSTLKPIGFDMDRDRAKDAVASYEFLPLKSASVDVLVFDPPHLPKSGSKGVIKDLYNEFPTGTDPLTAFFHEAKRVLKPEGIVLAKTCDYVNSGRYRWQLVDLIAAVRECGLCPCDLIIKARPHALRHPAWTKQLHARKRHSFWVVIRNSTRC